MRVPVELRRAYRLLNHGATTIVTAAHEGRRNIMARALMNVRPSHLADPALFDFASLGLTP